MVLIPVIYPVTKIEKKYYSITKYINYIVW